MQLIKNNPYRILGLLVGASAALQNRHITRIPKYIDSGDEIPEEFTTFSFPVLGEIELTIQSVTDSASKLNLDSDKMNASLFWFYNGNSITDEPAFDAIKESDLDQAISIWTKLISNGEVSQRNASAYSNLGTLYLSGILEGTNTNEALLEQGISLKLKFLESDFIKDFKALATDETYKTTKKELQLLFLNQLHSDIEGSKKSSIPKFLEILNKQEFVAKQDFMKGFVQKPIEHIEQKIETSKNKRKASKANASKAGQELFSTATTDLAQLKSIVGSNDLKYTSVADKVANEILQCSIDYFNDSQEKDSNTDYAETSMKLAKQAETLAVSNLTKDRIKESINSLAEMKDREFSAAIQALQSIKDAYEEACKQIDKQVDELQYDTLPSFGGSAPMRMPKFNVSINWSKVEEMKRKALAWDKVVELIQRVIPQKNIDKIKNINNQTSQNEYKSLVNFVMSKLNYSQKNKVRYISFWETVSKSSPTTSSTSSQSDFDFAENAWWILGLIGLVIGAAAGGGGGAFVGAIIGVGIGSKFK